MPDIKSKGFVFRRVGNCVVIETLFADEYSAMEFFDNLTSDETTKVTLTLRGKRPVQ